MNIKQRHHIAERLKEIALAHGGKVVFMEDYAPMRQTTLSFAMRGVGVSTDIDERFAMLHWYGADKPLNLAIFGSVNKAHGRKATTYCDTWGGLYPEFKRLCAAVQSGDAFLPDTQ